MITYKGNVIYPHKIILFLIIIFILILFITLFKNKIKLFFSSKVNSTNKNTQKQIKETENILISKPFITAVKIGFGIALGMFLFSLLLSLIFGFSVLAFFNKIVGAIFK